MVGRDGGRDRAAGLAILNVQGARAARPQSMGASNSNLPPGAWAFAQADGMIWVADGYFIGKYLVTNIEYGAFVDATGHRPLSQAGQGLLRLACLP